MSYAKVWESKNAEYRAESLEYLRTWFPVGSTVTTTVKHVTDSGMGRTIAVLASDPTNGISNVSHHVARVLDWKYDNDRRGVYVQGCGMDMAFHLTYTLARVLYADQDSDGRAGYLLNNRNV
jgi:hypothetical protein